jgi:hypothetical protein
MVNEFTICGAGIAGLYTAYKLLLINPNYKITILEKNKYIGGRIIVTSFCGVNVPIGAGIGRTHKDHLLIQLLDNLNLIYHEGISSSQHIGHNILDLQHIIEKLKDLYKNKPIHEPFNKFAQRLMNKEDYNNFVINTGYSDFNNTDVYDVLYNYGIDDTYSNQKIIYVPWNDMINRLVTFIKSKGCIIKLGYTVHSLNNNILYYSKTHSINNKTMKTMKTININNNKLIIATTISHIRKLLPKYKIYNSISATPFMRIYGEFAENVRSIIANKISKTTILNKPLQEIIPINPESGVYMIIYNDNGSAIKLYNKLSSLNNTSTEITSNDVGPYTPNYNTRCINYIEKKLAKALELPLTNIKINKIALYFWREGTHYFKPLPKIYNNRNDFIKHAQFPKENIYVVGESVAQHQGWCEGALTSVENIINDLTI